jgi:AcrR family transcriptional regulator
MRVVTPDPRTAAGGRAGEVRPRSRDPRARRTRDRLVRAYVELSKTASGDAPSVSHIVRAAGINRSSFYAHFTDVGDLSLYVLETALASVYESGAASLRAGVRRDLAATTGTMIIDAVVSNAGALRAAVRQNRPLARRQIGVAIERSTIGLMRSLSGWEDAEREPLRLLVIYLSHGWSGVLCAWLAGEHELTPDQLLHELLALNPDGVRYLAAASVAAAAAEPAADLPSPLDR